MERNLQIRNLSENDRASTTAYESESFILHDFSIDQSEKKEQQEINFKEILDEIMHGMANAKGIARCVEMNINIRNEVPFLSSREQMHLVLNNLILNSTRYLNGATNKPFVYIKIHSHKIGTTILVRDNSTQDKKDFLPIFDLMNRMSKAEEFSEELHVVKETVEKLNGRIAIDSEVDFGNEFNIHLPHLYQ